MELYAKGQLSFLILTCLQERDFYGLDIISEISARSNGKINLKKPSVYSNLTRMEKQGYISSYLQSSDFGPNRKYYSLTEKGRGFYQELKAYFDYNNIDVFRDFVDVDVVSDNFLNSYDKKVTAVISKVQGQTINSAALQQSNDNVFVQSNESQENFENEETNQDEDDFFDFSSLTEDENNINKNQDEVSMQIENDEISVLENCDLQVQTNETEDLLMESNKFNDESKEPDIISKETVEEQSNEIIEEKQDDARFLVRESPVEEAVKENLSSNSSVKSYYDSEENDNSNVANLETEQTNVSEEKKDDAVFLPNENVDEYNKRIFDISKDINKIKRKRSFAEDQIAIAATDPLPVSNERKKANIEEFKNSLLENKNKYAYPNVTNYENNRGLNIIREEKKSVKEEPIKDDAVLVTGRLTPDDVGQAKRIAPPKIKIVSENTKDTRLPAPKRDSTVDPSHREILNRLYSKTKDSSSVETREDAIYDYNDLKDFYESQNINFSIYHKAVGNKKHNTNLIYLSISIASLLVSLLCSTLLYVIFLKTSMLNLHTNFMFILLPALLIFDVAWKYYNYKKYTSWMPSKLSPQWKIWCYFFLVSCIVIGLNLICGVATKQFSLFATTLILPLVLAFVLIPCRYYLKRIVLIKYWK